jgi:hypothetical protein
MHETVCSSSTAVKVRTIVSSDKVEVRVEILLRLWIVVQRHVEIGIQLSNLLALVDEHLLHVHWLWSKEPAERQTALAIRLIALHGLEQDQKVLLFKVLQFCHYGKDLTHILPITPHWPHVASLCVNPLVVCRTPLEPFKAVGVDFHEERGLATGLDLHGK